MKFENKIFKNYMKNINTINKKIININDSCFGKKNQTFCFINSPPISLKHSNNFQKEISSFSPTSYKRNINFFYLSDIMNSDITFDKLNFRLKKSQIKVVPLKEIMKKKERENYEKFVKDLSIPKERNKKRNLSSLY